MVPGAGRASTASAAGGKMPPVTNGDRLRVHPALDRAAAYAWRFLVIALAVALLAIAAARLRLIVIPVVLALFGAALFVPPVRWLQRRGLPGFLATLATILAAIAIVVGIGVLLAPGVRAEFAELGPVIREGIGDVRDWVSATFNVSEEQIDELITQGEEWVRENTRTLATGVLTGATVALEIAAGFLLTFVLLFFFVKDGERIVDWLQSHVRPENRDLSRALGRRSWGVLGSYLRGTALVGLVDAVFIGIGLFVLGVPLVIPLMLLTFVGAFLPLVGATLAGIAAALVALVSGGFVDALIVVGIVLAVQQVEGNVLQPFVMGRAMNLHPIVILVAITAGAILGGMVGLGGIAGAFVAVPVTAVLAAVGNELRLRRLGETEVPAP